MLLFCFLAVAAVLALPSLRAESSALVVENGDMNVLNVSVAATLLALQERPTLRLCGATDTADRCSTVFSSGSAVTPLSSNITGVAIGDHWFTYSYLSPLVGGAANAPGSRVRAVTYHAYIGGRVQFYVGGAISTLLVTNCNIKINDSSRALVWFAAGDTDRVWLQKDVQVFVNAQRCLSFTYSTTATSQGAFTLGIRITASWIETF